MREGAVGHPESHREGPPPSPTSFGPSWKSLSHVPPVLRHGAQPRQPRRQPRALPRSRQNSNPLKSWSFWGSLALVKTVFSSRREPTSHLFAGSLFWDPLRSTYLLLKSASKAAQNYIFSDFGDPIGVLFEPIFQPGVALGPFSTFLFFSLSQAGATLCPG